LLVKYFRRYPPPGSLPIHQLQRITCPVTLLVSEHDPYLNRLELEGAAHSKLTNPGADLIIITVPNAGHDIHNDQADLVSRYFHDLINLV
ncbi:MAG TPA: hypothetical protein VHL11_18380, partial [Phototrophicaceae bacterium]|nr:hypothetical protein [Phototrophicaceae bacterium]